jgi:hypothetical protein
MRKPVKITNGYRHLYLPEHPTSMKGGYIVEHRFVMEAMLGRLLERGEVVHHKNGDHGDNRPDNLELMIYSAHTRHHQGKRYGCAEPACFEPYAAKGYCMKHYKQYVNPHKRKERT